MSLLVVGSIALDDVETPTSNRKNLLGGSAVYFSYAASYFTPVHLVGAVGDDWPPEHVEMLRSRRIDTTGLQTIPGAKTFRWRGKYLENMNDRETLEVHLNVLGEFDPILHDGCKDVPFLFLANASPTVQGRVLDQARRPKLTVMDTMDLWIKTQHDELLALLKRVDGLVLNDSEARLLADDENLLRAGRYALSLGPKFVVVKKGEHGAIFLTKDDAVVLPAFPTSQVVDPTGAGDSFAGGMLGYLAHCGEVSTASLKSALAYGTVVASFNVEDFSLDRLQKIDRSDLDLRFQQYKQMLAI